MRDMDTNGVLTVVCWAAIIGVTACWWCEERGWRKDEKRAARLLGMRSDLAGGFSEKDVAMAEAIREEWHPLDELDRLEAEDREFCAELGEWADAADEIAHLNVFRESEWAH